MRGFRAANLASKRTTAKNATLTVNAVANATLTVTGVAAAAGAVGNTKRVVLITGAPTINVALAASYTSPTITVTLGTDNSGVLDDTKNTGTLVAAVIDALDDFTCATSGTGAGIVAPVAVQSLSGGHDVFTVRDLAKAANVSDRLIQALERGDNCEVQTGQRIADVLSETLATLGTRL